MSIHEYLCINGHRVEVLEPMESPNRRPCDECGSESFRVFSAPNLAADGRYSYGDVPTRKPGEKP